MGITGDIILTSSEFKAAGKALPIAVVAEAESFKTDDGARQVEIMRIVKPANPSFLNHNHICNGPIRWMTAYRDDHGKALNIAFFSSIDRPTREDDSGLCGTFLYTR